jgi:hypothetical protein
VAARRLRLGHVHRTFAADRSRDRRHLGLVAVGADADHGLLAKVDAVEIGQKPVHEMHPRLLAVAHDVDPGVLLQLYRKHGGVDFPLLEGIARELPGRPEPLRLGEPGGLRQASGEGGFEHGEPR